MGFVVYLQYDQRACFIVYLQFMRAALHSRARAYYMQKKFFSGLGVGWVGKWLAEIALQLPVLQILGYCIYYSDNLKDSIKDS